MKDLFDFIGRVLLSFIFLYEAYDSVIYYQATKAKMSAYGIGGNQDVWLVGAIVLLLIGGLLLLSGYRVGLGGTLVLCYWIPVTFIVHSWWNDPLPEQRYEAIMFMRNLAIAGGVLHVIAHGSGRYSIRRIFATTRVPH